MQEVLDAPFRLAREHRLVYPRYGVATAPACDWSRGKGVLAA